MTTDRMINRGAVLSWFTGKAREKAAYALGLLDASIENGSWLRGASRTVTASLSKANVARKWAEKQHHVLPFEVKHAMEYGQFWRGAELAVGEHAEAARWVKDFAPVVAAIARLDRTRPMPNFTSLGVSPTITATVELMNLVPSNIRVPPMRYVKIERKNPRTGLDEIVTLIEILWPKQTLHASSRFATGESQCHSCGHAIRDPYNWVPLLADGKDAVPRSLWVGRDCAERLFGVKATGALEYAPGSRTIHPEVR